MLSFGVLSTWQEPAPARDRCGVERARKNEKKSDPNKSASPIRSPFTTLYVIIIIIDIDIRSFEWMNCLWANRDLILCSHRRDTIFLQLIFILSYDAYYTRIWHWCARSLASLMSMHCLYSFIFFYFISLPVRVRAWARVRAIMPSRRFCRCCSSAYDDDDDDDDASILCAAAVAVFFCTLTFRFSTIVYFSEVSSTAMMFLNFFFFIFILALIESLRSLG